MLLQFNYSMNLFFSEPVEDHFFSLLCIPGQTERQLVQNLRIDVNPETAFSRDTDGLGNQKIYGVIHESHADFCLSVNGLVETKPVFYEEYEDPESINLYRYRVSSSYTAPGTALNSLYHSWKSDEPDDPYGKLLYYLEKVHVLLRYVPGTTNVKTTAEDSVRIGTGVCQDYTHVLISLLRMAGIPARYVVGLMQGEGESHAWAEANCRGYWYGVDPTNYYLVNESYIKLSHGRDYGDCMISRGIFKNPSAEQIMKVSVSVGPVNSQGDAD